MTRNRLSLALILLTVTTLALAAPVVVVKSPAAGSSIGSPINYVASASSSSCAKGISAIQIYTAPGVNAYTIHANQLNTNINLPKGTYQTVVQAWDKCGGVGKTAVNITVSKINFAPPRFLYATEFKAGKVTEYVVNPLTGAISPTSQGWAWTHWGPVDLASDYWGNRLYVANQGSHDVSAYAINRSNGNLTQTPGSPFMLPGIGRRVAVVPSGKFVYATSTGGSGGQSGINAFVVQSDGSLKPVAGSPFDSSVVGPLAITPNGKYLYASEDQNKIAGFEIDATSGALTPLPGSPFLAPAYPGCTQFCTVSPTDLSVDRTGNYLYGSQSAQDAVAGFKIDPTTGTLTNLPGSPYAEGSFNTSNTPKDPWRLSIAPSNKFIYVADDEGNDFSVFRMNASTGTLTFVASIGNVSVNPLRGVCVPYTVNADPSGTFVYSLGITTSLCTPGGNAVLGYSMNQGSGTLLSVPGSPFPNADVHTTITSEEKVLVTR